MFFFNSNIIHSKPIPNAQHVFEEHHVVPNTEPANATVAAPAAAASDAFGGELADAGAVDGYTLLDVMGLIVIMSS